MTITDISQKSFDDRQNDQLRNYLSLSLFFLFLVSAVSVGILPVIHTKFCNRIHPFFKKKKAEKKLFN